MASRSPSYAVNVSTFKTKLNIKIAVIKGNITTPAVDCVFRPVNYQLNSDDGVSRTIENAIGTSAIKEVRARVLSQNNNTFPMKEVFVSTGGDHWKRVCNARVSQKHWKDDPELRREELTETIFRCLKKAHALKMTSIALPSVHTQATSVTAEDTATCYTHAIIKFDGECGDETLLRQIIFVDEDQHVIDRMRIELKNNEKIEIDHTLRIVLIGRTGVGKSRTGNSIIGQDYFRSYDQFKPVTNKSGLGSVGDIEVVDTPGIFDNGGPEETEEILKEILKSVLFSLPGPHVFLLLLNAKERWDREQEDLLKQVREIFTGDFCHFLVIVFTHCKNEEARNRLLEQSPQSLEDLRRDCENRVLDIENGEDTRPESCAKQVTAIIETVKKLKRRNLERGAEYYTNRVVDRCLQVLQSTNTKQPIEELKKNIEIVERAAAHKNLLKEIRQRCTIL